MDKVLFRQAIGKFLSGLLLVGLLLFLPAGTFAYWQAWLLLGVLFVPMFFAGLIMLRRSVTASPGISPPSEAALSYTAPMTQ